MKAFLILLLSLAALAVVAAIFVFDVFSELGSHRVTGNEKVPFASMGMTRDQYIEYLLKTERHDDPELWQRIEAVRNLTPWPK